MKLLAKHLTLDKQPDLRLLQATSNIRNASGWFTGDAVQRQVENSPTRLSTASLGSPH